MHYSGKPDLSSSGLYASPEVTETALWTGAPSEEEPYQHSVEIEAAKKAALHLPLSYPVIFNIERYGLDVRTTEQAEVEANIGRLSQVFDWARPWLPKQRIGLYAFMPLRDYFMSDVPAWQAANDLLAPLVSKVSALYPSLYTFYDDQPGWVTYAQGNIAEAQRIAGGRPIYPFLWPQYHSSAPGELPGTFLSGEYWTLQLQTVFEAGCDGVVIWGGTDAWDDEAEWWVATLAFIATLN